MDDLGRLIVTHEDWLTDRVVHYAQLGGHATYTSTLREAWRASVAQLSVPLVAALAGAAADGTPRRAAREAAAAYCLDQARRHRERGIDLDMFLGLLVFYRRSYLDLVEEHHAAPADRRRMLIALMEIFDAIELRLVRDIVDSNASDDHRRLQARNRALANEKNKYLTVFESLADPALLTDSDDAPVHMNAAGHRILLGEDAPGLGYYGTPDFGRLRAILAPVLDAPVLDLIAGEADDRDGITLETSGGPRVFSVASRKLLDISGKFDGRVILLRDVTDYLAATEAARDAERAKAALLATFSHEIRTPINGILALTQLMDASPLDPEQHRHVARLRESGQVLSDLVENILGLSRVEARALQRLDQEFNLGEVLRGVMLTIEPTATQKGLEIACDIADDVPRQLHGDMQKLRHILMNLLSNAIGFTVQGGVRLAVALVAPPDSAGCRLRFEVSDTGPGLPPGPTDWLFTPFAQYHHPGLEQGQRGSGLGLAICRAFVGFLGGSIGAQMRPGGGAVFAFDLPFARASRSPARGRQPTGLAILLVEDDEVSANVTQAWLRQLGHLPTVVSGIAEARRQLGASRFDLVVSDQRLGDGRGTDLARHLRAVEDARSNALPVVLITADVTEVAGLPPALVQYIIAKPFGPEDLAQAIRQARLSGAPVDGGPPPVEAGPDLRFDPQRLDQMRADLGPERCARIIDSYLDTVGRLAAELSRHGAGGDISALAGTVHKLASASSMVGLTSIAERAKQALKTCRSGTRPQLGREIMQLRATVLRSRDALARYREALGGVEGSTGAGARPNVSAR